MTAPPKRRWSFSRQTLLVYVLVILVAFVAVFIVTTILIFDTAPTSMPIDRRKLMLIQNGVTTRAEVEEILGKLIDWRGSLYEYQHIDRNYRWEIHFDANGKVQDVSPRQYFEHNGIML